MTIDISPDDLDIIIFPHPTLRYRAKPVQRVDAKLKAIVARMFELMYEHRGVGLAATQVNLPLRLFVMNPMGRKGEGTESVLINPVLSKPRSHEEDEEGCLSLPGLTGNVIRSKSIHVTAFGIDGKEVNSEFSGYEARVIQHENDHLDGTLFIDRMKDGAASEMADSIDAMQTDFESQQRTGSIADDQQLAEQITYWEKQYC